MYAPVFSLMVLPAATNSSHVQLPSSGMATPAFSKTSVR